MTLTRISMCSIAYVGVSVLADIRGVDPNKESKFQNVGGFFQCHDGSSRIPYDALNDEYCDCADGSDEPGTSACSNSRFYCPCIGDSPTLIPSSFVNDGICDCCDGTDEWKLGGCTDTCEEQGVRLREERRLYREKVMAGLEKKKEITHTADIQIKEWKASLEQKKLQAESVESVRQRLSEQHEELVKKVMLPTRFLDRADRVDEANAEAKKNTLEEAEKEALLKESSQTNETLLDQLGDVVNNGIDAVKGMFATQSELEQERDRVRSDLDLAVEKSANLSDEIRDLETNVNLSDHERACFDLRDRCFQKTMTSYTYEVCFFKNASQKDGSTSISLGSNVEWVDSKVRFSEGQRCWNGPQRSLTVTFECGVEPEILSLDEPSICVYEALMSHPSACHEEDVANDSTDEERPEL